MSDDDSLYHGFMRLKHPPKPWYKRLFAWIKKILGVKL